MTLASNLKGASIDAELTLDDGDDDDIDDDGISLSAALERSAARSRLAAHTRSVRT